MGNGKISSRHGFKNTTNLFKAAILRFHSHAIRGPFLGMFYCQVKVRSSRSIQSLYLTSIVVPAPMSVFGASINPGAEWTIDEGGMNAFMPEHFRCEAKAANERPVLQVAWGPPGRPSPDRLTEYETFVPNVPSSHDPELCTGCQERKMYTDHVEQQRKDSEAAFDSMGMGRRASKDHGTSSHSPLKPSPCDGIMDIIITGDTDLEYGQVCIQPNLFPVHAQLSNTLCRAGFTTTSSAACVFGTVSFAFYGSRRTHRPTTRRSCFTCMPSLITTLLEASGGYMGVVFRKTWLPRMFITLRRA